MEAIAIVLAFVGMFSLMWGPIGKAPPVHEPEEGWVDEPPRAPLFPYSRLLVKFQPSREWQALSTSQRRTRCLRGVLAIVAGGGELLGWWSAFSV
jgi:hypothetical protein